MERDCYCLLLYATALTVCVFLANIVFYLNRSYAAQFLSERFQLLYVEVRKTQTEESKLTCYLSAVALAQRPADHQATIILAPRRSNDDEKLFCVSFYIH